MGDISKVVANMLYPAQKYIKTHYLVDHKTSELRPLTFLVVGRVLIETTHNSHEYYMVMTLCND
jgi:hypothetical protein